MKPLSKKHAKKFAIDISIVVIGSHLGTHGTSGWRTHLNVAVGGKPSGAIALNSGG
jgi:hypothetical protein